MELEARYPPRRCGEPLVLVHGIGHTWRGWKPMLPLLERNFDVLAPDLPGFGHSPPLPPDRPAAPPEALADAVEHEMDAAGFQTAHVAGNSLGGWISLELARRGRARDGDRDLARRPGPPARDGLGPRAAAEHAVGARSTPAPEPLLRNPVGRTAARRTGARQPWRADPADMVEQARAVRRTRPGMLPTLERTLEGRRPLGPRELDCPVLLLWGTRT